VFALRVNQSGLAVRRMSNAAGPAGGVSNALDATPVASSVSAHFFEAAESIEWTKEGRTEDFDGVLVTKQGLGIAEYDLVEINNKWYEFAGADVDALPGLDAWRIQRYKRKVVE
jgi:hypothetical protein